MDKWEEQSSSDVLGDLQEAADMVRHANTPVFASMPAVIFKAMSRQLYPDDKKVEKLLNDIPDNCTVFINNGDI